MTPRWRAEFVVVARHFTCTDQNRHTSLFERRSAAVVSIPATMTLFSARRAVRAPPPPRDSSCARREFSSDGNPALRIARSDPVGSRPRRSVDVDERDAASPGGIRSDRRSAVEIDLEICPNRWMFSPCRGKPVPSAVTYTGPPSAEPRRRLVARSRWRRRRSGAAPSTSPGQDAPMFR